MQEWDGSCLSVPEGNQSFQQPSKRDPIAVSGCVKELVETQKATWSPSQGCWCVAMLGSERGLVDELWWERLTEQLRCSFARSAPIMQPDHTPALRVPRRNLRSNRKAPF